MENKEKIEELGHEIDQVESNSIKGFYAYIKKRLENSEKYLDMGVKDSNAQFAVDVQNDKLPTLYAAYADYEKAITDTIMGYAISFLEEYKGIIDEVWLSRPPEVSNHLHFVISLKKNDIKNRTELNLFPKICEDTGMAMKFPVFFHYVSQDLVSKANHSVKIF